jgi:hypothetical protein
MYKSWLSRRASIRYSLHCGIGRPAVYFVKIYFKFANPYASILKRRCGDCRHPLIKKKIKIFSYVRKFRVDQLQSHICMRKGFLIHEEMSKYFPIYRKSVSHIWLCNCSILNFLICKKNLIFFLPVNSRAVCNTFWSHERWCALISNLSVDFLKWDFMRRHARILVIAV